MIMRKESIFIIKIRWINSSRFLWDTSLLNQIKWKQIKNYVPKFLFELFNNGFGFS